MKKPGAFIRWGFTLIELLIVVSIIAILSAIALPNLLEAQTRSKVARAKADMRTIVTSLESYSADNGKYPPSVLIPLYARYIFLTTPVGYLSSIPYDAFNVIDDPHHDIYRANHNYFLTTMPEDTLKLYVLRSDGPDKVDNDFYVEAYSGYFPEIWENPDSGFYFIRYDPTNGTVSPGDIWRLSDYQMD